MFGQPSGGFSFGGASAGGTPGGGFGQPAAGGFGAAPAAGGFGGTSVFGQPATGGFGSTAPSTGFGATSTPFGQTPQPAAGGFGAAAAGGGFGAGTSAFGAKPAGFGATTSAFGAPAASPFGATTSSTGFGATTTTTATGFGGFGASTTTPAFGSTTSAFGAPKPAFGAATTSTPFGGGTTGGFGSTPAPAGGLGGFGTSGGGFGATTGGLGGMGGFGNVAAANGTAGVPYQETDWDDGGNRVKLVAITAMPQYEKKSLEELRFEDYSEGRKSKAGVGAGGLGGGFGMAASTPATGGFGGFGAASTTQPATSAFGSSLTAPKPGGFGLSTTTASPFGAAAAKPANPFGAATSTPAAGGFGGFGATTTATTGFGQTPAPTGGLFGSSTTTPAPAFGAAAATPSPFGAKPATTGFGVTTTTPAFGAAQPAASPFGAASTAPKPAFGAPATGGLFGATSTTTTTPSTGLFGAQTTQPAAGGGLFGSTTTGTTGGGLFGAANTAAPKPLGGFGTTAPATSAFGTGGLGFGSQQAAKPGGLFSSGGTLGATTTTPGFQTPSLQLGGLTGASPFQTPAPQTALAPQTPGTLSATAASLQLTTQNAYPVLSAVKKQEQLRQQQQEQQKPNAPESKPAVPAAPHFVYTPPSATRIRARVFNDSAEAEPKSLSMSHRKQFLKLKIDSDIQPIDGLSGGRGGGDQGGVSQQGDHVNHTPLITRAGPRTQAGGEAPRTPTPVNGAAPLEPPFWIEDPEHVYTVPSLEAINKMSLEERKHVRDFTVGNDMYGKVHFLVPVDLTKFKELHQDRAIDDVVRFAEKEVLVYEGFSTEDDSGSDAPPKPARGQGLNVRARITLEKCYPRSTQNLDRAKKAQWDKKLAKNTADMGASDSVFDWETGRWSFTVEHFSRYGLNVDDDDEDEDAMVDSDEAFDDSRISDPELEAHGALPSDGDLSFEDDKGKRVDIDEGLVDESAVSDAEVPSDADLEESSWADGASLAVDQQAVTAPQPSVLYYLGVRPERVQEKKYGYHFPDVESDDISTRAAPPAWPVSRTPSSVAVVPRVAEVEARRPVRTMAPKAQDTVAQYDEHIASALFRANQPDMNRDFFMGRTFRAGWGPGGVLVCPKIMVRADTTDSSRNPFVNAVTLNKLVVAPVLPNVPNADRPPARAGEPVCIVCGNEDSSADDQEVMGEPLVDPLENLRVTYCSACKLRNKEHISKVVEAHLNVYTDGIFASDEVFALPKLKTPSAAVLVSRMIDCVGDSSKGHGQPGEQWRLVWTLVKALWLLDNGADAMDQGAEASEEDWKDELSARSLTWQQRVRLSEWLRRAARDNVQHERGQRSSGDQAAAKDVFTLLTGGLIREACEVARQSRDMRLALLLAQAMGPESERELVLKQLEEWWERQYVGDAAGKNLISQDRWKVYQLLTGCLRHSDPVDGRALYGDGYGIVKDVDWKRAFAMQYWYACPQNATVRDGLLKYDQCWTSAPATRESRPPLPPFVERNRLSDERVWDTCYYLLWLRQQPEQPQGLERIMSSLLSPAAYTSTWLDYNLGASHQLSWHLCTALFSLAQNTSSNLYRYNELMSTRTYHTIVRNFAMELEVQGLWQLAIFVLLHLPGFACVVRDPDSNDAVMLPSDSLDVRMRQSLTYAVREILCRHVPDESDLNILSKIGVPADWIYEAQALRSLADGDDRAQAEALLHMGPYAQFLPSDQAVDGVSEQWVSAPYVRCHNLLKERLLPAAVAGLDDSLREVLEQLRAIAGQENYIIEDWQSQGEVYYEYLVEFDMLSGEWLAQTQQWSPAEIELVQDKLRGAISALAARCSAAEANGSPQECNTTSRFARTTILTRMVRTYIQLEEHKAPSTSMAESIEYVEAMLPYMDMSSTYTTLQNLTHTYLQTV